MSHPCDGHACDNCATCRSGVCCMTVGSASAVAASPAADDALRAAIVNDQRPAPQLADLIRSEAIGRGLEPAERLALPAPPPLDSLFVNHPNRKEKDEVPNRSDR